MESSSVDCLFFLFSCIDMFSQSCDRFIIVGIIYALYTLFVTQRDKNKRQTIHIHISIQLILSLYLESYHNLVEFTHYLLETSDISDVIFV